MKRKLQLFCLLLSVISTASHATALKGLYIGAGVGPDMAKFQVNSYIQQSSGGFLTFNVANKVQQSGNGVFGTAFLGYGFPCCFGTLPYLYYVAAELNANWSSLKHKNSNDEFVSGNLNSTTYKMYNNFGVSILPGFYLNAPTLIYARLGYSNASFKISTTDASVGNLNKRLGGFRWGVGVEETVTPQFAGRMEFSQVNYSSARTFTLDTLSNTSKLAKFTPTNSAVEFSLVYSFA